MVGTPRLLQFKHAFLRKEAQTHQVRGALAAAASESDKELLNELHLHLSSLLVVLELDASGHSVAILFKELLQGPRHALEMIEFTWAGARWGRC